MTDSIISICRHWQESELSRFLTRLRLSAGRTPRVREFDLLFVIRVRDGFTSSCLCQPALHFYSVTSGTESEGPSSTRTSALAMSPHSSSLDDRRRLGALGNSY